MKQYLFTSAPAVKDIRWVLTVPAIWGDGAKQFMREASFKVSELSKKEKNIIYSI